MAAAGSLHIKGVSYQYLKDTERFERTGQVIIYSEGIIVIWNSMALASLISNFNSAMIKTSIGVIGA